MSGAWHSLAAAVIPYHTREIERHEGLEARLVFGLLDVDEGCEPDQSLRTGW